MKFSNPNKLDIGSALADVGSVQADVGSVPDFWVGILGLSSTRIIFGLSLPKNKMCDYIREI